MKIVESHIQNKNFSSAIKESTKLSESFAKILALISDLDYEKTTKENTKHHIQVELLCNWTSSEKLCKLWNKMSKSGDYTWGKIKIGWDFKRPDYYVVINCPPIHKFPDPKKTIVFHMEPHIPKHPELWGDWSNPVKHCLKVCFHETHHNNIEWHLGKSYTELLAFKPDKTKGDIISSILSSKYRDKGHIQRVDFVKFLEKKGLDVDVYGSNRWDYKCYKGSLEYHKKDEGLFPYKYTFNVENNSIKNYFTEKIVDGILSECLVFYSGCFNLKEYLDPDAFVYLELSDFESDYKKIEKAIKENLWEKRLPAIRRAKKKILTELQFFPRLENMITKLKNNHTT